MLPAMQQLTAGKVHNLSDHNVHSCHSLQMKVKVHMALRNGGAGYLELDIEDMGFSCIHRLRLLEF